MTFGDPEDITLPSDDGQVIRLPFAALPSGAAGIPGEADQTTKHELIIRLAGSRASSWGLDASRARAVMIHAAVEHLLDLARHRGFPRSGDLLIDAGTFPGPMPERFDRPISIAGSTIEVERAGNAIGGDSSEPG